MGTILQQILQEYGQGNKCKIRDQKHVEDVLESLVRDGPSKLQVITDFDFTLTRFHKDGVRCQSAHGIMDHSPLMPEAYRQKAQAIASKYYPIEIDPALTIERKIPLMVEWYNLSHELLVEYKVSKSTLKQMANESKALLRDSAAGVLCYLNKHNVPVLIFSAGVGDLLEEVLLRDKCFYPNIKVISNYMVFNNDGICVGFKRPLIHMFNKNETALDNNPNYFKDLSHRGNALVLGDSLGDANMDKGLHNPGSILKIGFLNDKIDERMESFLSTFDVVLVDDQSFRFVDLIVKKIMCP